MVTTTTSLSSQCLREVNYQWQKRIYLEGDLGAAGCEGGRDLKKDGRNAGETKKQRRSLVSWKMCFHFHQNADCDLYFWVSKPSDTY